jgi:hypothetical protein
MHATVCATLTIVVAVTSNNAPEQAISALESTLALHSGVVISPQAPPQSQVRISGK